MFDPNIFVSKLNTIYFISPLLYPEGKNLKNPCFARVVSYFAPLIIFNPVIPEYQGCTLGIDF
ncbi:hypothetical protein MTBBW1_1680046 [Desulfamplus magnetovallimortis]|uniref:Uncharacterized protein n=1 Tax=Desulfamplus magnetovallimortis TaxID=1246637 RepID=A0A1W1H9L2_9BACT|nr:hypothetical protein MTBBW1_1680046 [Desulfamplus magnetovallimortis]